MASRSIALEGPTTGRGPGVVPGWIPVAALTQWDTSAAARGPAAGDSPALPPPTAAPFARVGGARATSAWPMPLASP
ncbi:hypothetical protein [Microbacterium sp.]|uniref:hypothetical protein n=1 Tax=Microbacterium sp. TaxID=51671 RepID=UPI0025F17223|nr:hypothetical protein [Microbacterium sp.]MBT9606234.1 hypothetical protein [Microbacterium sp.]